MSSTTSSPILKPLSTPPSPSSSTTTSFTFQNDESTIEIEINKDENDQTTNFYLHPDFNAYPVVEGEEEEEEEIEIINIRKSIKRSLSAESMYSEEDGENEEEDDDE